MSAISTVNTTTTITTVRLARRPSAIRQLALTEAKLYVREWYGPVIGIGLPIILLLVFGSISAVKETTSFDGRSLMYEYVPVVILMGAALMCLISSAGTMATYRERGVLRRFGTTPAGATRLLAADLIVSMTTVLIMAAAISVIARLLYRVALPAQFGGFILTLLLAVMALMGIGLCIASFAKTARMAHGIGAVFFYPMMFFSGLWLPISSMSPTLQHISHATPLGAAVTAMADTLTGEFPPLLYLGILACWAVATGLLARRMFRWS